MIRARGWCLLGGGVVLALAVAFVSGPAVSLGTQDAPRVDTGIVDLFGRPVSVSCESCHAKFPAHPARRSATEPEMEFHRGLVFEHGTLACGACHAADAYDSLRLADGATVPYADATHLCAQCHAPQARDYAYGTHGGMTGYWDARRGPQERKRCIDCHDAHAPQYPSMEPLFKPIDRFREPPRGHHD